MKDELVEAQADVERARLALSLAKTEQRRFDILIELESAQRRLHLYELEYCV
jgi:hypothetical protein